MKLLYHVNKIAAVLAFITMLYYVREGLTEGGITWWVFAIEQGLFSAFFWYFADFIKKNA